MKFEEALKLMREGKKVRCKSWDKEIYIELNENHFVTYTGECWELFEEEEILGEWEEYSELKPNHEIPESERKAFEEGFKCAVTLYEKRIKELEAKRVYWSKRFKELEAKV